VIPWGGRFPQKGGSLVKINSFMEKKSARQEKYAAYVSLTIDNFFNKNITWRRAKRPRPEKVEQ